MKTVISQENLNKVLKLCHEAGKLAAQMRSSIDIKEKTGPQDLVTSADIALSELIVSTLSREFPGALIVSEEDKELPGQILPDQSKEIWVIDPIDGTENYIRGDGQYSVMVGLLHNMHPVFGCVYEPHSNHLYYGGEGLGAWKIKPGENKPPQDLVLQKEKNQFEAGDKSTNPNRKTRLMMGHRDRKKHPWVEDLEYIRFVKYGSIGLKVARILEDHADLFVHLAGKLKVWDTAAPSAIAIAAGLEVGTMEENSLSFHLPEVYHRHPVIIGKKGSLKWCRQILSNKTATLNSDVI